MRKKLTLLTLSVLVLTSASSAQEVFSIDAGSGSPFAAGDILTAGPFVSIPDIGIALAGALTGAEIDGLSDGMDPFNDELYFSVDSGSTGFPATAVAAEFAGAGFGALDQTADIFQTPLTGTNTLFRDGDGFPNPGAAPGFGLIEPFPTAADNLDAFDVGMIGSPGPIFFTVGAAAPAALPTDTILMVPGPGGPVAPFVGGLSLALTSTDDIDAIFIDDAGTLGVFDPADTVAFSLSRTSPSLLAGSALDLAFGVGGAMSPADVFVFAPGGVPVYISASMLGLPFGANVDALETVPEPATMSLIGLGALALLRRRRS